MKTYSLEFLPSALKEWLSLEKTVKEQFKNKLAERLANPRVDSARLRGMPDCDKIKLVALGYRLVYRVDESTVTVAVVALGKRERSVAYRAAWLRI